MAGVLVFLSVVGAYLLYRYVPWQHYWQLCWRSVGPSEGISLSSTALSTADMDESLLGPSSSRARRAAASQSQSGGDPSSRFVR